MTYGCPVIYAGKSGVEDLVGQAGCALSEITPSELYKAMRKFFVSRHARSQAISKGYMEAFKFKWDTTARATLSFYKLLLEDSDRDPSSTQRNTESRIPSLRDAKREEQ